MLNSTHTLVSPTPTTLEGYLLEFESSMSVSFVSEYSRKSCFAKINNPFCNIIAHSLEPHPRKNDTCAMKNQPSLF